MVLKIPISPRLKRRLSSRALAEGKDTVDIVREAIEEKLQQKPIVTKQQLVTRRRPRLSPIDRHDLRAAERRLNDSTDRVRPFNAST
jgi:hypothetical protein